MNNQPEIIAIDDDQMFMTDLRTHFQEQEIPVATLLDPFLSSALDFSKFKIVVLDLDMPNISGQEVLAGMRTDRRPTVIVVSAYGDIETRLQLLSAGADFFMTKPVNFSELTLICRRILGRQIVTAEQSNHWSLSRTRHTMTTPDGTVLGLTTSEFLILELLFASSPNFVKKETLAQAVTARNDTSVNAFYRSLEVMISRMRTRFSKPDEPLPIRALRNVGYIFFGNCIFKD